MLNTIRKCIGLILIIPGLVLFASGFAIVDLDKDSDIEWISQDYAEYNLYYQTIAGDPTDGYKGVPGFGTIKTSDWLRNNPSCTLDDIKQLYIDNTGSDEGFAINYRLAKLVSFDEYDFEKGEVKNVKYN